VLIKNEGRTLEVDEVGELFGLFTRAIIDYHDELAHISNGDISKEFGIRDTEDKTSDFEPLFDEVNVFDFSVGEVDGLHFALSAAEDVAFHTPRELYVVWEEAELANHVFPAEWVGSWDVEIDVNRVCQKHRGRGRG